jgi:hypothetical protein
MEASTQCRYVERSPPAEALQELGTMPSLQRLLAVVAETRRKYKPLIEQVRKQKVR